MKLILIDGGPASGKNTLGALLVEQLRKDGNTVILLDLDTYVEKINPSWVWENKKNEERDQLQAREDFAADIQKFLQKNYTIIVIGERFLTKQDIAAFVNRIKIPCFVNLFHLSVPIDLRRKRLVERGTHSLIDIKKDQKERDAIALWPAYVYKNINSPEIDANNLAQLIHDLKGAIDRVEK